MNAESSSTEKRRDSYGELRSFRGLESFAIQSRLNKAYLLLKSLRETNAEKQLKILELGCGFWGRNLQALRQDFPEIKFTGVDIKVTPQRTEGIELIVGDITRWKPTEAYDGVLSLAVVEHLLDPEQHFKLITDGLKSRGLACVTTPAPTAHFILETLAALHIFDPDEIKDHQLYLTESGLKNLAAGAGLVVEEYNRISFGFNHWMLLRKQ